MDTQIVNLMTFEEARSCADAIKVSLNNIGQKLLELYEREGWVVLGYSSWRECTQSEFGFQQSRVYQLLDFAQTQRIISTNGGNDASLNERQSRALAGLEPEQKVEVHKEAVETAPGGKVTARHVKETRDRVISASVNKHEEIDSEATGELTHGPVEVTEPSPVDEPSFCVMCEEPMIDSEDAICDDCMDQHFPQPTGVIHEVKCDSSMFYMISQRAKPFEIRKNDRNYQSGDTIVVKEWDGNQHTGYSIQGTIGFMLYQGYGLQKGHVAMAIEWDRS